jgi:ElaB/YqjD/DUF883 family membrane-anchored ribosome-binding protein
MRSTDLTSELHALKREISRAMHGNNDSAAGAAKTRVEEVAGQIKTALADLGEALGDEDRHLHALLAERPLATLASAFALGVAVGVLLRRR